jgi:hypothetical protein
MNIYTLQITSKKINLNKTLDIFLHFLRNISLDLVLFKENSCSVHQLVIDQSVIPKTGVVLFLTFSNKNDDNDEKKLSPSKHFSVPYFIGHLS